MLMFERILFTPESDAWSDHLKDCPTCLKAIKGRFAGIKMAQMYKSCCPEGKSLYRAWIIKVDNKDLADENCDI